MRIGAHETHPLADAFPLMDDALLKALADSIRVFGLRRKPVLLIEPEFPEGRILDGRHRCMACEIVGIEPEFQIYNGDTDIAELANYVADANLMRRDMDPIQRATTLRRLTKLIRKRKERSKSQPVLPGVTETDHAIESQLGACSEEVGAAFASGELTLAEAVAASRLDEDEQRELVKRLDETPAAAPVRSQEHRSVVIALTLPDLAALRAGVAVLEASPHGVVRAAAALVRRMGAL
jgi:ParB-like chromosome segregation protein Spo0J